MSKKSKATAQQKRMKEKRKRKQTMRLLYEQRRKDGTNKKSKRFKKSTKGSDRLKSLCYPHSVQIPCGNIACNKCY